VTGRRLFGVETEYAVTAVHVNGTVIPAVELADAILRAAERLLPSLPGSHDAGLFLGNGSRLYVDAGAHPEIAGPECLNPWDVVRYLRAGDRMLRRLADDVQQRNAILAEARLFIGNVDYSGTGSTWGSHESYCHRADPGLLRRRLVPHLVSRVIFSGAGGFNPGSRGLEFTLSPRTLQLEHVVSGGSTHDRPIAHTRDEPLAAHRYRRQHLICGDSVRSDIATWLRVGTTALVVAMIDGGVTCGDEVELRMPVEAMRAVAGDPSCRQPMRLKHGGTATAIEVQRHYLGQARAHVRESFMPSWAGEVCERWGEMLDRLADGPDRVSATLDWAIKLAFYRDRVRRRGFDWKSLPEWSRALDAIERVRSSGKGPFPALTTAVLTNDDRLRAEAEDLTPALQAAGGSWDQLDALLALRRELFEVDTRWGMLGSGSVFEQLDRAGVLDHRVTGVERIDEAAEQPPAEGRARVRGMVIQRLWRQRDRYSCGWDHVWNLRARGALDLSDPLTDAEIWRTPPIRQKVAGPGPAASATTRSRADEASVFAEIQRLVSRVRSRRRTRSPESPGS
jgi:hypothetical protein